MIDDKSKLFTSFGVVEDIGKVRVTPRTSTWKSILPSKKRLGITVSEAKQLAKLEKMDIWKISGVTKPIRTLKPRPTGKVQEMETLLIKLKDDISQVKVVGAAEFIPAKTLKKKMITETKGIRSIVELIEVPRARVPKPTTVITPPVLVGERAELVVKKITAPTIVSFKEMSMIRQPGTKEIREVKVKAAERAKIKIISPMIKPAFRQPYKTKQLYEGISITKTTPVVATMLVPKTRQISRQQFIKPTKPVMTTVTTMVPPVVTPFIGTKPPGPRPPKPPKPIKPIKPIVILIDKKIQKRLARKPTPKIKPKPGYEVEIKRKGEWVDITPFALSEGEALALGRRETKAGAEVSFRLKKGDGIGGTLNLAPITRAELKEEYRGRIVKGKEVKSPTTFIQKRKARIATAGEFLAITAKGIEKRKAKSLAKKGDVKWI